MSFITPQLLYKIAAGLFAISVPGHALMGVQIVHSALNTIAPTTNDRRVAQAGAKNSWDWVNAGLAIEGKATVASALITAGLTLLALLTWQWARTNGPRTSEERAIVLAILAAGLWAGRRYYRAGAYAPLGCMWVAPICTAVATWKTMAA
jgi:hypothetical protein